MFRPLSRQTFKALRSPIHLSASRHVHSVQAPYTTYDTIARRSSSYPDLRDFFVHKRQQEARERGEYIDIHDVSGVDPEDFDFLITGVNKKLRTEISEELGIPYLSKATEADVKEVVQIGHGYLYGRKLRTIFPFVVSCSGKAHWVFFIFDTGAPLTYISGQASELFGIKRERPSPVKIAGYHHQVNMSPPDSHFPDINILGLDFCNSHHVSLWYDYVNGRVKLFFGGEWEVIRKPKL